MNTEYYYAPGMMYPYWYVKVRDGETVWAHNADSETDMGDLFDEEFHECFPRAVQITKRQFDERSVVV